ncbi:MAG: hypothetical protein QOI25_5102, partial [Mycobacterium sp.]|nr:hypothetical protein [Mycobacterium sp.]
MVSAVGVIWYLEGRVARADERPQLVGAEVLSAARTGHPATGSGIAG